jgi:hypothetical protein
MDEVLAAALDLGDPGGFLREGDHDIDEIHELKSPDRSVEVPAPAGVN